MPCLEFSYIIITTVARVSNALPQCVHSKNTVDEILALYMLLYCHSKHVEPRIVYDVYNCCTIVTNVGLYQCLGITYSRDG